MNGDFDLYVLNGKIKELSEKIISINNSIDSIKTEFNTLNIGNTGDTGGNTTAGTVMAKLNAALSKVNTISTATGKIGSSGDTAKTTLFGKLNSIIDTSGDGMKIVKSIQRIVFSEYPSATTYQLTISPVNPDRCILYYLDNFIDSNAKGTLKFALESNSLNVTYTCGARYQRIVEFWIIEFC